MISAFGILAIPLAVLFLVWRDQDRTVSNLAVGFFVAGLIAGVAALQINTSIRGVLAGPVSLFAMSMAEELLKLFAYYMALRHFKIYPALLTAMLVAAAFAWAENLLYVFRFGADVVFLRLFGPTLLHLLVSAFYVEVLKKNYVVANLAAAILMHFLYNLMVERGLIEGAFALVSAGLSVILVWNWALPQRR